jgi:hypothetical protein
MNWLTPEEAIRSAFEYRWRGSKSKEPILLTDFDVNNLRVLQVSPGDWDDVATWHVLERPMTDAEFSAINSYIRDSRGTMAVGEEVMQEQGHPVRVRGYIKRHYQESHGWNATLDLDEVRRELNSVSYNADGSFDEE